MRCDVDKKTETVPAVSIELRKRVRYRLSADAIFAWEGPERSRLVAEGVTRDISVAGAFIFTRTCPPLGTSVDLEIILSPAPESGRNAVRIKTEAKVIRVEHAEVEGFAATSQDFTLLFEENSGGSFGVTGIDSGE
jgi:hypothetical protein